MPETIDQKILLEIEEGLKRNHIDGVVILKKSAFQQRANNLMAGIVDYLQSRGYDTLPREDDDEYHISFILKPF